VTARARGAWAALGRSFTLRPPAADDRRAATQAAASVGVALVAVLALGRLDWSAYATFGAFASLYGRNQPAASRLVRQVVAAVALTVAVTAGAAVGGLPHPDWWLVLGGGVVAFAGSALVAMEEWRPPGALFLVFAFGAVGSVAGAGTVLPAFLVSGASAAAAVLMGNASAVVSRPPRAPMQLSRRPTWDPVLAAGAVLLAGAASTLLGIGHTYWASVAAAAVVTGRNAHHQLRRAAERLMGSLLGLLTAAALVAVVTHEVAIVVTVAMLQLLAEIVVARNYTVALLFITPQALLMGQLAAPQSLGPLLRDRAVETVVGVGSAVVVVLLSRVAQIRGGDHLA